LREIADFERHALEGEAVIKGWGHLCNNHLD
jgi:hypothetical protein